jgi:hypothetical protein
MGYPTAAEVEAADRVQLAGWVRYLRSPGWDAVGTPEFDETMKVEGERMRRILERFRDLGGMTPAISKHIDGGGAR